MRYEVSFSAKFKTRPNVLMKGLFNLVNNDSQLPSAKKQFRAFVATFICTCLEKGGYFATSKDLDQDKLFIGTRELEKT